MKEIELINKRRVNEKHFLQKNGTIVAKIYDSNIHYLENGKYVDIDNSFKKDGTSYVNKCNDYHVYFSEDITKPLFRMEKDNFFVEFDLKGKKRIAIEEDETHSNYIGCITYNNIMDSIDLQYKALPNKVKETIILRNSSVKMIEYTINTNLELSMDNNSILACNQGEIIFNFDKPYMEDSANHISDNVIYKLEQQDNIYILKILFDLDWLNSKDVIYPVYVDPTITNYTQYNSVKDTYIYPGDTGISRGSLPILKAGVEKVNNNNVVNRTLLCFDLPTIGTGSEIVAAYLSLIGYPEVTGQSNHKKVVEVHRVTCDWDESTADWNTMNDKFDPKIETIQYIARSKVENNILIPDTSYDYSDITNLVKHWYKDTDNFGILIKSVDEATYAGDNFPAFYSKNNTLYGDNPKPLLEITYINENGLEEYLNYIKQTHTSGTTYVNAYNGNLVGEFQLLEIKGTTIPMALNLIYNTNDVITRNDGFKFNFVETIRQVQIDDQNYFEYVDGDGTIHYFFEYTRRVPLPSVNFVTQEDYDNPANYQTLTSYIDEDGLGYEIRQDNNNYSIYDKYGGKKTYVLINNNTYYLSNIEDSDGNSISVSYDNNERLISIIDSDSNQLTINYPDNNTIVVSSSIETCTINKNGVKVNSITGPLGTVSFDYNNKNLISSVNDQTGIIIDYDYYDQIPYRVKKISKVGLDSSTGVTLDINYGFGFTDIIDKTGKKDTLIFDSGGRLISINSVSDDENISNAYSLVKGIGGMSVYTVNKLAYEDMPVRYVKNYLLNSSFEETTTPFIPSTGITQMISNQHSFCGTNSLELISNLNPGYTSYTISVPKGDYYTFSLDIKNTNSVELSLSYEKNGIIVETTESIEANSDFEREDITIYYDDDATTDLVIKIRMTANSIVYIDNVQLESGEVANLYNLLDNSDFSNGINDWSCEAYEKDYTQFDQDGNPISHAIPVSNVFDVIRFNNNKNTALRIKMNPIRDSSFGKRINVSGYQGEVYNISFWMKNKGILGNGHFVYNDVLIYFHPVDGIDESCLIRSPQFTPNNQWQYFSYKYEAIKDFDYIDIYFSQCNCANEMYITNLVLNKAVSTNYYDYDENGNLIDISDGFGRQELYEYDSNNQLIKSIDSIGGGRRIEYDNVKTNRVLGTTTAMGLSYQVKYDSNGRPVRTRFYHQIGDDFTAGVYKVRSKGTNKYLKYVDGLLVMKSDSCSNNAWQFTNNGNLDEYSIMNPVINNKCVSVINNKLVLSNVLSYFEIEQSQNGSYYIKKKFNDPQTNEERYKYLNVLSDETLEFSSLIVGNPSFEFYFENVSTEFIQYDATYTSDGRFLTSITDSNFNKTIYNTDPNTELISSETNANGITTTYQYDNNKHLSSITQGNMMIEYTYDNELLTKITQNNTEYNLEYDDFLNLKKSKIGDDITLSTNYYNLYTNELASIIYGNSNTIAYFYDDLNRIDTIRKMDKDYKYRYDANNNIAKIYWGMNVEKYTYDLINRIRKYSFDNFKIKYEYDNNNNVVDKLYKLGNNSNHIVNTYNRDGSVISSQIDNDDYSYTYDSLGRLSSILLNNDYDIHYGYLSAGNRTSIIPNRLINGSDEYFYKYDGVYNIKEIYYNNNLVCSYDYDDNGQLICENNTNNNTKTIYSYDGSGNIQSKIIKNLQTDVVIETINYQYNNSNWKDLLTSYDGVNITYDSIGNPTAIGNNISLSWINGRQLSQYSDTSKNISITYEYNADNIRTKKVINNVVTNYYVEKNNIIYEETGTDYMYFIRDLTGLRGVIYNGYTYYYVKNLQNDIVGILDSNFDRIVTYTYDSWGNILSIKDNNGVEITNHNNIGLKNPYRYRSYYYDSETELYYLNSRYYNPKWCRFINSDAYFETNSIINNLFAYCMNNPLSYNDNNGNSSLAAVFSDTFNAVKSVVEALDEASTAVGVALEFGAKVTVVTMAVYLLYKLSEAADTASASMKKAEKNYNVYTLRKKDSNKVEYVGITNNLERRKEEHKKNIYRRHLDLHEEVVNITYVQARTYEQVLITKCQTLKRNKKQPVNNQINSISPKRPDFDYYWDMGVNMDMVHEVSCN